MLAPDQTREAESSDDDAKIASLEAEIHRLKQIKQQKHKAQRIYESLVRRYRKKENLPSRPCGDLRPQRYSSTPNAGLKSITIATFLHLTKYLTKTEIEDLSASSKQLDAAAKLLSQEVDFPNHWYSCYTTWRNLSSLYAAEFFLGMSPTSIGVLFLTLLDAEATEAIKLAHNIHESSNMIEPRPPKRQRLEQTETSRLDLPSYCPSHASEGSNNWEARSNEVHGSGPTDRESNDISLGDQVLRDDTKQNDVPQASTSNIQTTATTVSFAIPSPVKYTLAYAHKAEIAKCFAPLFVERLRGTAAWGRDKTTTCIRAHALEDAVEFEIDWGYPAAPPTLDVFLEGAWGEVAIKQVTQLTIRVPFTKGQDVIQRLFYPSTTTQE
ncbi:hypothetical protein CABS02_14387 [Colletotrichum abscissum]|uniref:Uncharacterized protein n=1 Tax=Colletotrichum abscissum TaxID=1671311 RepID=A0A9P9X1G9_9PEZI|nr:hypothetical protein CABS02_14387 [Colletotrichum abscissum]